MATLNTSYGWSNGDQVRLLIASGLPVGSYQITQITTCMNHLGSISTDAVSSVLDLIDQFEEAQTRYNELNNKGDSRVLIKADVLEWAEAKQMSYSPVNEIARIRGLIYQYMGSCNLYGDGYGAQTTQLFRS
jgi:hypothetical protein